MRQDRTDRNWFVGIGLFYSAYWGSFRIVNRLPRFQNCVNAHITIIAFFFTYMHVRIPHFVMRTWMLYRMPGFANSFKLTITEKDSITMDMGFKNALMTSIKCCGIRRFNQGAIIRRVNLWLRPPEKVLCDFEGTSEYPTIYIQEYTYMMIHLDDISWWYIMNWRLRIDI